jgi:hypothetical protein
MALRTSEAQVRPRSLADARRVGQHETVKATEAEVSRVGSQRVDDGQADSAVETEPAGDPGRAQERHVVAGDQDRPAVAFQRLGQLADRRQVQVVGRLVEQQQLGRGLRQEQGREDGPEPLAA